MTWKWFTLSFTVDTTPPTCANVPQGVLEVVELGVTGTLVDWVELTCEDQSGTAFVTERTHNPSSFFEVGMTTVTYTCTDTSGNSQLCPFLVTVITGNGGFQTWHWLTQWWNMSHKWS